MGTDIHSVFQAKINGRWEDIKTEYNEDRHYMLFAWLADVRNGFGFAGVTTHTPLKPISAPRGLPDDFELDWDEHNGRWMGDHSHSWLHIDEILNAEPPQVSATGIITVEDYKSWDGNRPDTYCGGISGPGIKISKSDKIEKDTTHVQVNWLSSGELDYFIQIVRSLKAKYPDVRMVFGFDS